MKILVAPLNWGLGHASRCVPLVQRFLEEGHEVILGGDGASLTLLRRHFPKCRYVFLAPLDLRYGKGKRQVWAMVKALPKLVAWAYKDHVMLQAVLREEKIDMVVSDNRFGLYTNHQSPITVYITHQLHIFLPKGWRWLEPLVSRLHARIYTRYNKVWVPDYAEPENEAGSYTDIVIDGDVYGRALRTHKDVKPVFVSIGNFISLDTACALALQLTDKESHIPIPTRLADLETHIARDAERS